MNIHGFRISTQVDHFWDQSWQISRKLKKAGTENIRINLKFGDLICLNLRPFLEETLGRLTANERYARAQSWLASLKISWLESWLTFTQPYTQWYVSHIVNGKHWSLTKETSGLLQLTTLPLVLSGSMSFPKPVANFREDCNTPRSNLLRIPCEVPSLRWRHLRWCPQIQRSRATFAPRNLCTQALDVMTSIGPTWWLRQGKQVKNHLIWKSIFGKLQKSISRFRIN